MHYHSTGEERVDIRETFQIQEEVRDCKKSFDKSKGVLSASWEDWYAEAKNYYEQKGNLLPLRTYETPEGYPLGQWIAMQRIRKRKGMLPSECVEKLEAIGMDWRTNSERRWEDGFLSAEKYFNEEGNLKTSEQMPSKLKLWLISQRQKERAGKLTKEQSARLSAIGMIWKKEDEWQKKYELAKAYFEKFGNLDIPVTYETKEGVKLGIWYRSVRNLYREGMLSEERIAAMEEIGMQWESMKGRIWTKYYRHAKAYYEKRGNLNVNLHYITEDGLKLGIWIASQRAFYSSSKAPFAQIQL
ncbi:MAG: helicase associated domain-containing protein [Clostridia bacterium]|nr:helicase associated domain-containing protein [Clostridia bacterium]